MKDLFRKIATKVSTWTGSATAFLLATVVVLVWAFTGPIFDYSNTWQLVINTCTTIGTFLMVFLIQNTQNRDGKAAQLKLDELIRVTKGRDRLIDVEDMSDDEIQELDDQFRALHEKQLVTAAMRKLHGKLQAVHAVRKTNR